MIQFKTGEHYENHIGKYIVNKFLSKDTMKVTYEGTLNTACLNTAIQSRIIENGVLEQRVAKVVDKKHKKHIPNKPSFYRTLGYLCEHCRIFFILPEHKLDTLQDFYHKIKNEDILIEYHMNKNLFFEENKWSFTGKLLFTKPKTISIDDFDLYHDFYLEIYNSKKNKKDVQYLSKSTPIVANRKIISLLLQFGFRIGKQDYDEIVKEIPAEFKEIFEEGRKIK
jgi:hypothetical protein